MAAVAGLILFLSASSAASAGFTEVQIPEVFADVKSCLNQPSFFSCENTTTIANTCCSPTPGGLGA